MAISKNQKKGKKQIIIGQCADCKNTKDLHPVQRCTPSGRKHMVKLCDECKMTV